jgi:hypothetical protein
MFFYELKNEIRKYVFRGAQTREEVEVEAKVEERSNRVFGIIWELIF